VTHTDFALRLLMALFLGATIGLERQWRQRLAGLRTNALVSTGSALFVALTFLTTGEPSPTRIAAQVVCGIGFLGAGIIMRDGLSVRGLNTAATLWCAAGVGTLTGSGFIIEATLGTVAVLAANVMLRPLANRINQQPCNTPETETRYHVRVTSRSADEAHVRALLLQAVNGGPVMLRSLHSEDVEPLGKVEVRAQLITGDRSDVLMEQIVSRLSLESGVTAVSWAVVPDDEGSLAQLAGEQS
jgi:putative Mg2+ transporter-C (MgtC) family protein